MSGRMTPFDPPAASHQRMLLTCSRRRTLGNVLVLERLRGGQTIIFIEKISLIDCSQYQRPTGRKRRMGRTGVGFPIPTLNNPNTTSSDVLESKMETSEIVTDDQEQSVRRHRVLGGGEEGGVESEGDGDLGGSEKVRLEDRLVESDKGFEDLRVVLRDDSPASIVRQ